MTPLPLLHSAQAKASAAGDAAGDKKASRGFSLQVSKMSFASKNADTQIDINDPDFWTKYLPMTDAERYSPDRLLAQLTDGSVSVHHLETSSDLTLTACMMGGCIVVIRLWYPLRRDQTSGTL